MLEHTHLLVHKTACLQTSPRLSPTPMPPVLARGAGTDASVFVEIFGDGGKSSGPLPLDPGPSRPDAFTRGASDAFTKALPPLGDLQRLSVWTDGRGSAWHMDYISVEQNGSQGTEGSKGERVQLRS